MVCVEKIQTAVAFKKSNGNSNVTAKTNNVEKISEKQKKNHLALSLAGLSLLGIAGIYSYKKIKALNSDTIRATITDKEYYKNIQEGLKTEGIDVKLSSLKSIVAPNEFAKLIKKYKPEHFRVGMQVSKTSAENIPTEKFYENLINGDFRVSLHTHSNFSDGKATVVEFLDSARKYADKVAKMNKKDGLPPLMIALTDHDCVNGCAEAIKIIAKNPEKYKNLKFVCGCEFSVRNGDKHHDITGLVLNPFDINLRQTLADLRNSRKNIIEDFLEKQPEYNGKKVTFSDLVKYEKEHYVKSGKSGKHSIENGSGIVCVRHGIKFYYQYTNQPVNHKLMNELGNKEILPIETVLSLIKMNNGYASLTHPVKSFWRYIGEEELNKLKKMGIQGIEVNHQYSPSKISELGKHNNTTDSDKLFKQISEEYRNYADKNGLFISGGTDSHEKQIFSREPKISDNILNNKIYKTPDEIK